MPRPMKSRCVCTRPEADYFKPRGIPMNELAEVVLTLDEFEALHWADGEGMYHVKAAQKLKVSRQTFGNILKSARWKIADVLIHAKALKIEGGVVRFTQDLQPKAANSNTRSKS